MYNENNQELDTTNSYHSNILEKYSSMPNIADDLDYNLLCDIGMQVLTGAENDKDTQREWLQQVDEAKKLAKLVKEPKNYPLPSSANIKFPLIINACYQYAARTYPEIIKDGKVVKAEVLGKDPTGVYTIVGDAIATHMSSQLLGEDTRWEANLDNLLVTYANIGFVCKKKFYNPVTRKVDESVCYYEDLILRNGEDIASLDDLQRITHVLHLTKNDLVEGVRHGIYCRDEVESILNMYADKYSDHCIDIYEQHRWLDLDNDGYQEPYIVSVEKTTGKVIRIVARFQADDIEYNDEKQVKFIKAFNHFVAFRFLPSPDGTFMSLGFGTLMLHLNETINTILNQLIDAGTLANLQIGFVDARLKVMQGTMFGEAGTWFTAKGVADGGRIGDMITPLNYKEPSTVLFQLLGLLIESSKELASSTDVMSGTAEAQNSPANTMAILAEQGMKVFSSIQKRLYRALKEEFQKIHHLNKVYLDPQQVVDVVGDSLPIARDLYKIPTIKVIPVADPNLSSSSQRLAKGQYLLNMLQNPNIASFINIKHLLSSLLQWVDLPNAEQYLVDPQPQPDPALLKIQAQAQNHANQNMIKQRQMALREKEFVAKLDKIQAEVDQMQANSARLYAQAGKDRKEGDASVDRVQLDAIKTKLEHIRDAHKQAIETAQKTKQMELDELYRVRDEARNNEAKRRNNNDDEDVEGNDKPVE